MRLEILDHSDFRQYLKLGETFTFLLDRILNPLHVISNLIFAIPKNSAPHLTPTTTYQSTMSSSEVPTIPIMPSPSPSPCPPHQQIKEMHTSPNFFYSDHTMEEGKDWMKKRRNGLISSEKHTATDHLCQDPHFQPFLLCSHRMMHQYKAAAQMEELKRPICRSIEKSYNVFHCHTMYHIVF